MSRTLVAVPVYLAVVIAAIAAYDSLAGNQIDAWLVVVLVAVHIATGFVVGRAAALLLPVIPAVLAAFVTDDPARGLAIAFVIVLLTIPGVVAVAAGLGLRALTARSASTSARPS